MSNTAGVL